MTQLEARPGNAAAPPVVQQAVHFGFYKLRPEWWQLDAPERRHIGQDLLDLVGRWRERMLIVPFSLVGLRADCDLMFWKAAESIDDVQAFGIDLASSSIGRYLEPVRAYLSLTKRSMYVREHEHADGENSRTRIRPVGAKYLFVYPFVKKREWYALPLEDRQRMMNDHIRSGHQYPRVRIHTSYSFGLDDQEFVLAFESDYPNDFLDLVMELRETEASAYTERDTPIFTCIKAEGDALLTALGAGI